MSTTIKHIHVYIEKQTKSKSSGMQKACNIGTAIDGGKGLSLKESVKGMIEGIDCLNWDRHWIIHSTDSIKTTDSFRNLNLLLLLLWDAAVLLWFLEVEQKQTMQLRYSILSLYLLNCRIKTISHSESCSWSEYLCVRDCLQHLHSYDIA